MSKITRTCAHPDCTNKFLVSQAVVNRGGGRYCSKGCASSARKKPRITKSCPACGKEFEVIDGRNEGKTYCSRGCANEDNRRKREEEEAQNVSAMIRVEGANDLTDWPYDLPNTEEGISLASLDPFSAHELTQFKLRFKAEGKL